MLEYKTPDEYIADVQKHIRWKRAKIVATAEVSDHIDDQYDAFVANGFDESTAMKKAIQEMGSAETVGRELDGVHRPKIDWILLALTTILLAIGILVSFLLLTPAAVFSKACAIGCGVVVVIVMYFTDYTLLIRYPKLIYGILTALTLFVSVWELRNGFYVTGYSYAYYLLLFYPVSLVGILFQLRYRKSNIPIVQYTLYVCLPLVLSMLNKSFTAFVLLLVTAIFMLIYSVKLHWFKWDKLNIIGSSSIIVLLSVVVVFSNQLYNIIPDGFYMRQDLFSQLNLFSALSNSVPIGKSTVLADGAMVDYLFDHPISLLLYNCGILPVTILVCVFGILFYLLYRTMKKQNADIGKLLATMILLIFGVKIICTFVYEMGLLPYFNTGFPFVTTGGVFIIYDMTLIGIILSISRNESIAKEWVKLKEKRRIKDE